MSPIIELGNGKENNLSKPALKPKSEVSFFDINQLELAIIYHALEGNPDAPKFSNVEVGETKRILELQRDNLVKAIKSKGGETDPKALKKELDLIWSRRKMPGPKCFPPLKDKHKEKDGKEPDQKN